MRLIDLAERSGVKSERHVDDLEITGLTADSRHVKPGFLFAALAGTRQHGRDFVADAVARGAVAVLGCEPDSKRLKDRIAGRAAILTDAEPRRCYARMAAAYYGAQPEIVAAVTGTNGKTSVAEFARQIWQGMGFVSASLGTLGVRGSTGERTGTLTTPDPADLHRTLADLACNHVTHLALEASSHGLSQYRLDGVRIRAAAFTNLSRDHLDYHATMEDYRDAKLRLFSEVLADDGTAIVPTAGAETEAIARIAAARGLRLLRYGIDDGDVCCTDRRATGSGWSLRLSVEKESFDVDFPLPGEFQILNALAAVALVLACGAGASASVPLLSTLAPVPGRLQCAAVRPNGARILVDYAHTPDALRAALTAARTHTRGRLAVVFGAGGDRDPGKRPEMGRIAAALADDVIVTDDNPRSEDPAAIRRAILEACPGAREIGDRAAAIFTAVATLGPEDTLVVAGKGHEKGQILRHKTIPFDDVAVAATAAAADGGTE